MKKQFSLIRPKVGRLGNDEFSLSLQRTIPQDADHGWLPAYLFEMVADRQVVGRCTLRVGSNDAVCYVGNIGYEVREEFRGHHYAVRASRLLLGLARKHGMKQALITCQAENPASRKTCEHLGARLCQELEVPQSHPLYAEGCRRLLQYCVDLSFLIFPAVEEDLPKLGALYDIITRREAQEGNFSGWAVGEYPQEWTARELFEAGGLYVLLDEDSGELIGSAAYDNRHDDAFEQVRWSRDIPNDRTLCIHTLAVHPDYRRRGLGEQLMRFGVEQMRRQGLLGIRIDTWVGNLPGLRLYHRLGYRDVNILNQNVHYEGDTMAYQFLEWYDRDLPRENDAINGI